MREYDLFPPNSLLDRGQLNDFEFRVWLSYQRYREQERILKDYPNKSKETFLKCKETYLQSGLDFDNHQPLDIPHHFWCAVKYDNIVEFISAFNSRKVEKATWEKYSFPSKKFRSKTYASILPPSAGVIFFHLNYPMQKFGHYQHVLETLHNEMSWISSWLGEAFCFWAEANGLNNGYIKWVDGGCVRANSSNEETSFAYGMPFDQEENPDEKIWVSDIYKTADNLGLNVRKIVPKAPDEELYIWYVGLD